MLSTLTETLSSQMMWAGPSHQTIQQHPNNRSHPHISHPPDPCLLQGPPRPSRGTRWIVPFGCPRSARAVVEALSQALGSPRPTNCGARSPPRRRGGVAECAPQGVQRIFELQDVGRIDVGIQGHHAKLPTRSGTEPLKCVYSHQSEPSFLLDAAS